MFRKKEKNLENLKEYFVITYIKYISRKTFQEDRAACVYVYHFILIDQNFSIISRENKNIS